MWWGNHSLRAVAAVAALGVGVVVGCGDVGDVARPSTPAIDTPTDDAAPPEPAVVAPKVASCSAPARAQPSVVFAPAFTGLPVHLPTQLVQDRATPSRWYVIQMTGEVLGFDAAAPAAAETVFVVPRQIQVDFNGGLVGIALHPDFAFNGQAFLHLSQVVGGGVQAVVARITTTDGGHTFGDYTEIIGPLDEPAGMDHHGGGLAFGPDGMLYVSIGDGGCCADPVFNGQSKQGLHAKVLRIDVDTPPAPGETFVVPPGNPFVGTEVEPATYARGFRNPWRMTFDRETGDLWLGDVGDNLWEEIDRVVAGGNYGWPCREGSHDNLLTPDHCPSTAGLVDPYFEYGHKGNAAITGGRVYRGNAVPDLVGSYLYGDNVTMGVWAVPANVPPAARIPVQLNAGGPDGIWVDFAEDADGEIYVVDLVGDRIVAIRPGTPAPGQIPAFLSHTGCVDPEDPTKASGVLTYDVASPLYSDGATKERGFTIPEGSAIAVSGTHLDLPPGSVATKTFLVGGKRIETRLLVRHADGEWAGYSYRWLDDESDAKLLLDADTRALPGQTWTFPSRSQCLECHTRAAGRSLGLDTRQLAPTALAEAVKRGWLPAVPTVTRLPTPSDPSKPLEDRARSYLHANCAQCHRPGGGAPTVFDLRFETPTTAAKLCNQDPTQGDLGVPGAKIVVPGMPGQSLVSLRMHRTDNQRMPRLGVSVTDAAGVALVDAWIGSLTACP